MFQHRKITTRVAHERGSLQLLRHIFKKKLKTEENNHANEILITQSLQACVVIYAKILQPW